VIVYRNVRKIGIHRSELEETNSLIAHAVDRVTGQLDTDLQVYWSKAKNRSVADSVRIEILDALSKLDK